jgi:hypothetical protein
MTPKNKARSNRNRNGGGSNRNGATAQTIQKAKGDELIVGAEKLDADELKRVGGDAVVEPEVIGDVDVNRLRAAVGKAERAQELAARRERDHIEAKRELDKRRDALDEQFAKQRTELDQRADELRAFEESLTHRQVKLDERDTEYGDRLKLLQDKEDNLFVMEQQARTGFADLRHEQLERLRAELDERRAAAEAQAQQQDEEANRRRAEAEQELAGRAAELDQKADRLEQQEFEHIRKERQLAAKEQYLEQDASDRAKETEARFVGQLDALRHELDGWRQRYQATAELAEQRGAEIAKRDAQTLAMGHISQQDAPAELARLRQHNEELRHELAGRPLIAQERLEALEIHARDLTVEREDLFRQNEELRRHLAASRISVVERESARVTTNALQQLNDTLRTEIAQLTARLEKLQASDGTSSPFPACSDMDRKREYREKPELPLSMPRLPDFVRRVRQLIAGTQHLYYSEADLRCFLGGLAASRLHLLQGISGIGKTRLPQAFAAAIGASCETVAVAAEWRSPQDLMGYYNAFEGKFYETEFTQALYKAQLPLFATKPFFVVLDEMNLSHPEQYFSDVLSAMERADGDSPALRLMTVRVDPSPDYLHDGRDLALPDNVWFVGTANHDETTVSFADKTYDRAHVLELPAKPESFEPGEPVPLLPISLDALLGEFDRAKVNQGSAADKVLKFLENQFGDLLRDDFGVSWGSRFDRQARSFVPVVIDAGGSIGEAADHLLATKVLRKLQGRVEVPPAELEALRTTVQERWPELDPAPGAKPAKSVRVLANEIRSRGVS